MGGLDVKRGDELPEDLYNSYLADESLVPTIEGKTVAITGTTSGLGVAIARAAISKKADLVLLLNRKSERASKAEEGLQKYKVEGSKTVIKTIDCDLMSFDSVKEAASVVNEEVKAYGGLDVLCNNAGIMAFDDDRTKDGFDVQMQTNQLSHFLLGALVFPSIKNAAGKRGEARLVTHSSSARDFPKTLLGKYMEKSEPNTLGGNGAWMLSQAFLGKEGPWTRYGQTKLANSCFAMALAGKVGDSNVKSICAEPGYAVTALQNTKHMSVSERMDSMFPKQSAADGSLPAVMACFSPSAENGDFYAPEKTMTGRPKKVVAKGERQKTGFIGGTDKNTCDPKQQDLVWEACKKATGFDFDL
mmetsp:Transcript_3501/g.7016  ORF Transcript_3501/g.7016 Transcript_3501/m.7016 type:complete len:359 (-) Transcript_3501:40-1116(-)